MGIFISLESLEFFLSEFGTEGFSSSDVLMKNLVYGYLGQFDIFISLELLENLSI